LVTSLRRKGTICAKLTTKCFRVKPTQSHKTWAHENATMVESNEQCISFFKTQIHQLLKEALNIITLKYVLYTWSWIRIFCLYIKHVVCTEHNLNKQKTNSNYLELMVEHSQQCISKSNSRDELHNWLNKERLLTNNVSLTLNILVTL
jgi:hypothetical protein